MKKIEDPKKFFDLLEKSIIEVIDRDGGVIKKDTLKLIEYRNKYSNLQTPSLTLFHGETPLKTSLFKIKYECSCGNVNIIHLKKFLNKSTLICPKCRETEEKRKRHSELLRNPNFKKKVNPTKINDLSKLIELSNNDFKLESSDFINNYFEKNLTISEFDRLKSNIVKINGVDIRGIEFQFIPFLKVGNQSKYSQYIIVGNKKTLLSNVQFKCEECGKHFNTTRKPKEKIKNHKIMCLSCSFCNKTFKIRRYTTKFGDGITYQSNLEKEFIEKCESLDIRVLDGYTINYSHNNKYRKYKIDFLLPEHNFLIELKGNHIWHRKQMKSGVWKIKQLSAENYSQSNGLTYKLLFQENIKNFFETIKI